MMTTTASMMIQMIASGEASGDLDQMLGRAAAFQEKQLKATISTTMSLFGPITLLLMASVVFIIVAAILMPIMQMNNLIT